MNGNILFMVYSENGYTQGTKETVFYSHNVKLHLIQ